MSGWWGRMGGYFESSPPQTWAVWIDRRGTTGGVWSNLLHLFALRASSC